MRKNTCLTLLAVLLVFTACSKGKSEGPTTARVASAPAAAPAASNAPASGSPVFRSVSPAEAQQMMAQRKDLRVVDVRNPDELRQGAIENSTLVPFGSLIQGRHELEPGQPLLLVCAVGGRSYAASQILLRQGFREVYNLSGGIAQWKKAGLPLKY